MYIYVGNLASETERGDLRREFEEFGEVSRAAIIMDRSTGASAGFGFVEMANQGSTDAALSGMVGKEIHGRLLQIRKTRQVVGAKPDSPKAA